MKRTCKFFLLPLMVALVTGGCDRAVDTSRAAKEVTMHAVEESKSSWRDFFSYHPPVPDPLPQTRYCYQMQSDITCYDSEQTRLTSKLVGYQDGENISWVQPGGGSLGASGGGPVALRPVPQQVFAAANRSAASESSSNFWSFDQFLSGLKRVGKQMNDRLAKASIIESTKGQIEVKNLGSSSPSAAVKKR